jgi:uncharacterized membrane protein
VIRAVEPFAGLREVPNVHMVVVHFPIALLPIGLACDVLGWLTGSRDLHIAGRWMLWIGTLTAGLAAWSGYEGADDVHPYVTDAAEELMDLHMNLQLGTLGAAVGLSLWRLMTRGPFPERGRLVYLLLAVAMVANLALASDFGGQMVFLHGVAVHVDADSLQGSEQKGHGEHHHHLFGGGEEHETEPGGHEHGHHAAH